MDPERRAYINRVLSQDPVSLQLVQRSNTLGVLRFLVYVAALIFALVTGFNQEYILLIGGLSVSFVIVMIIEYNRAATRARMQGRALQLGLIREEDLL